MADMADMADKTDKTDKTETAVATVALDDLAPGSVRRIVVGGVPVAVVRCDDDVYAIGDICSHANVSLSEGDVWCEERELECPKHSSTFSLTTGEPITLPATQPVPVYRVEVDGGTVTIHVGSGS